MTVKNIEAKVYAPTKLSPSRGGRGFSLKELREAGLEEGEAKRLGLFIDPRRKTAHPHNIKALKAFIKAREHRGQGKPSQGD